MNGLQGEKVGQCEGDGSPVNPAEVVFGMNVPVVPKLLYLP
jgi:hypothetical protein